MEPCHISQWVGSIGDSAVVVECGSEEQGRDGVESLSGRPVPNSVRQPSVPVTVSARVPFLHLLAPTLDDVDIPMTSIALPRELVHAVCGVVDTSSLAATLLVSHHWRALAQPRLLRSIVVRNADSDHNLTSFLAFLDSELCAVVAPHIQKLTLLGRRG